MSATLKKATLAVAATALVLLGAEAVLRLTDYGALAPELSFDTNARMGLERGQLAPHPDLFWTMPARATALDRALEAVHPDREPLPSRGRRRVLVLGDSCARLSVRGRPFSAVLQERLGDGHQVLNAGVPGYTSHQGLTWLRTQLLELEPEVTVVYFGWNDHWRATGLTDRVLARRRQPGRLRLLALLDRPAKPRPLRVSVEEYRENLRAIVDPLLDQGGRVILVAAPHRLTEEARRHLVRTDYLLADDRPGALHERYLEVVREFKGEDGVAVFAADALFRNLEGPLPLLHRDGIHPTDPAHAALGAVLARMIREGDGADGQVSASLIATARAAAASANLPAGRTER